MFPVRKVTAEHVSPLREEETRAFFFSQIGLHDVHVLNFSGPPRESRPLRRKPSGNA